MITKYCRLGHLKSRKLSSYSPGGWKPKMREPTGSGSGESPSRLADAAFLPHPHLQRERASWASSYKDSNLMTSSGPNYPVVHTITSGIGLRHRNVAGYPSVRGSPLPCPCLPAQLPTSSILPAPGVVAVSCSYSFCISLFFFSPAPYINLSLLKYLLQFLLS